MSSRIRWALALAAATLAGCDCGGAEGVDAGSPPGDFRCVSCLASADCGSDFCIQYGADVACAPACGADGTCAAGSECVVQTTTDGEQVSVCVPSGGACGVVPEDAGVPSPDASMPESCGGLTGPTASSCCHSCSQSSSRCQPNGCYGGWWCNEASCRCQAPPTTCGEPVPDGGTLPVPTGTVTASGGTVSRLYFAVLGDSRPAMADDTANYPTDVVHRLYADLEALSPRPELALVTGDYCFARPRGTAAHDQFSLYLGARAAYSGPVFFALGNHECTGYTDSNCGPNGADGLTTNYRAFVADMLAPIGQSLPYYSIRVDAIDGSWTSKIVVAAPNAWDTAQETWLTEAMAVPTTYTFVVRHEPSSATTAPGVGPIDAILGGSQYTLLIVGHTHTYYHARSSREVVIGLGGAPPTGSFDFGYLIVQQNAAGDIEVTEHDYATGAQNDRFAVHADGSRAP